MAAELTLSGLTIAFTKANVPSVSLTVPTITPSVAGSAWLDNTQSVGTSEEAILLGDPAVGGYCYMQNMDATNYVQIRSATGVAALIRLIAGDWCVFRLDASATAPFAIANTAAVNLRILRFAL